MTKIISRRLPLAFMLAATTSYCYASDAPSKTDVVKQNANIAYAVYHDSLTAAQSLKNAIDELVAQPTPKAFAAAKTAWLAAREPYGQTEVYRFRNGPIDDLGPDGKLVEGEGPEGQINAWPLDEALIDYVADSIDGNARNDNQPTTSLIQDREFSITPENLAASNELGDNEANVTTGYHAIEFLLWGQDLNQGETSWDGNALRDTSAGQRPLSDYFTDERCTNGTGNPAAPEICIRRGAYLKAAAALLVNDLQRVTDAWDPAGNDNYYGSFTDPANSDQSLLKMLLGMGSLSYGELAGERMLVALAANSQEDEHSCFSDNTHRDIYLDALGVHNTYFGDYTRTDGTVMNGPGINDLLVGEHADLGAQLAMQLNDTMAKVSRIDEMAKQGMPFDKLIEQFPGEDRDGRTILNANMANNLIVNDAIVALKTQTGSIEKAITALLGDVDYAIENSPAF